MLDIDFILTAGHHDGLINVYTYDALLRKKTSDTGHTEGVTDLVRVYDQSGQAALIMFASLDGSIRLWSRSPHSTPSTGSTYPNPSTGWATSGPPLRFNAWLPLLSPRCPLSARLRLL